MDDDLHQERTANLGSALGRLSKARDRRGPVGVLDPFELGASEQVAVSELPRVAQRRGLFHFSDRARDAVEHDIA